MTKRLNIYSTFLHSPDHFVALSIEYKLLYIISFIYSVNMDFSLRGIQYKTCTKSHARNRRMCHCASTYRKSTLWTLFKERCLYTLSDPIRRYRAIPRVVRYRGIGDLRTVKLMTMLDKDLYLWRGKVRTGDTRLEVRFQRIIDYY